MARGPGPPPREGVCGWRRQRPYVCIINRDLDSKAMSNSPITQINQRVAAFSEVRRIVAEHRGGKLFDEEAEALLDAASDMMLAQDRSQVQQAQETFDAQMDRLEAGRWAEMVGTDAHPGTAIKLRRAFARCAPESVPLAD